MNPITPLTPAQEAKQRASASHEGYAHRVIEEVDVTANVIADGKQDETISSRASRAAVAGKLWGRVLSRVLDGFQKNHGAKAQAADLERAEEIEALERSNGVLPD
jgi:hypothetical protein